MQTINMRNEAWERLLALRHGAEDVVLCDEPANLLYGPIAAATGRFVLAQVGQSLDGRIATPSGDALNVSGPDGLKHLHRCRALVDAVIVGVSTVKADNPRLSVRNVSGPDPVRVVIDCNAVLDGSESLFHDGGAPVIVVQSSEKQDRRLANAEIVNLSSQPSGLAPLDILNALEMRGLEKVLVEGGARTMARFIEAGLIDRLHIAISPIIIGSGPSGICLPPIEKLSEATRPETKVYNLGSDILFDCLLRPGASSVR